MSVIFYFSGTGNSLDAARQAAAVLPACRLESMAAYLASPYKVEDDVVGIVCPVYCFDLPPLAQQFAQALQAAPEYCFGMVTMGGNQGRALKHLQELLDKQNITLSYAAAIIMPDNFFLASKLKTDAVLTEADKMLAEVATHLHRRKLDVSLCQERRLWRYLGIPLGWWFLRNVLRVGSLSLRPQRCVGCGLCAQLCPVGNIVMENQRPVFGDKCAYCFGCRRWCPQHAIKIGGLKSKADLSYTNPNIKIQELLRQEVK